MMKTKFILFLLLFSLPVMAQVGTDIFYGQKIYAQDIKDPVLLESIADLQRQLQKATGKAFSSNVSSDVKKEGIQLLLLKPGLISPALTTQLQKGTIEDFVIDGNANRLLLVATHPLGLSRAIYTYLNHLGFKWYLPGEEWAVVPSKMDITLKAQYYEAPSFVLRDFFGTGGILPVKALDPNALLEKKWNDWKRRNRMGGIFHLGGHYGDTFNYKNKALLEQHPEYLALVNGKRQWSPDAKWCISNKNLRELFIADRVAELKERLRQNNYDNEIITVSVDPADGYGDCECDDCKKIGGGAHPIYFLANETAKALQKVSPRGYANIYAYNTHAAPPSFQLVSNLIVQVVPYAFQTVSSPEQLIESWKKKNLNLLLYDYYGIPDWHWDTPPTGGYAISSWMQRINYWKQVGIKGFVLESSYAIGSTGSGLYLSARKGWNANENTENLRQLFYKQLFGTAARFIEAYFTKLDSYSGAADMPYLLEQLNKSSQATTDEKVQQRIRIFKSYLHYLSLYYEHQQQPQNQEMLNSFVEYVLRLYPTAAIHSTYLTQLLSRNFSAGSPLSQKWKLFEPIGTQIKNITPVNEKEIEALFKQDLRKYPLLNGFPYLQTPSSASYTIKNKNAARTDKGEGMLILDWPETLVQPSTEGFIRFYIKVNEASQNNLTQNPVISLVDTLTKKEIYNQQIAIDAKWKTVEIKIPAGKTYKLVIQNSNWIRFAVPDVQWLAFKTIPTYAVLGKLWFYAEKESSFFYFTNSAQEQPVITNGSRVANIEKVNGNNLYRVNVSVGSGQWWSIEGTEYKKLQFYNKNLLLFPYSNIEARSNKQ
ncbi:MAG TPA: DUF4838 domain-containing protein [Flavisolibacter sp.]|nr:DUF4838 domain-containing protein [Flavisolibacter sp.]